jgi:hypothetical protein
MSTPRSEKGYRKALYRVDSADSKDGRKVLNGRIPKMAPQSKKLMNRNYIYNSPVGESLPELSSASEMIFSDADNV